MTTTQREPYPFVTKVIDLFGDWLKQRRELKELMEYAADPGELERVARELNVTPADLEMLVRQGSQAANELPYTLTALGIDETALRRAEPASYCATWSASVRSVRTSASAIRSSRPALLRRTMWSIAKTRIQSTC